MICPVCKEALVVFEYKDIELDYCPECMGVWFDEGEVELLVETVGLNPEQINLNLKKPEGAVTEAKRQCPICNKTMDKVTTQTGQIILDSCRKGDGIWFDAGELSSALKLMDSDSGNKDFSAVADFLGEALEDKEEEK